MHQIKPTYQIRSIDQIGPMYINWATHQIRLVCKKVTMHQIRSTSNLTMHQMDPMYQMDLCIKLTRHQMNPHIEWGQTLGPCTY